MRVSRRVNVLPGCKVRFQRDALRRVRAAIAIPRHAAIVEPVRETRTRARRNPTGNLRIILRGSGLGGNHPDNGVQASG
jgi:hypothetical protein